MNSSLRAWAAAAAGLWLAACAPQSEREREYFRQQEAERAERETLKLAIVESAKDTDVIQMVKQSASMRANLDTGVWVDQQMAQIQGQVIFPRWEVVRRGSSKYEARYSYTLLDADNNMAKRGWRWDVDIMLKIVSPPRDIVMEDSTHRKRSSETEMQQRRIVEEEKSLE
jgi:hypothetical protein